MKRSGGRDIARRFGRVAGGLLLALGIVVASAGQAAARYAAIVIDTQSGRVLHAENADALRFPASLTKMMTLYMVFEALEQGRLKLDQRLPVSGRAAAAAPSKLGLTPGQTITVRQAILGLVTKSANDAAVVVAEAMGGDEAEFARLMTRKAREIGMTRSTFRNPHGLPNPQQISTARDMATLGIALLRNFPRHYRYFSTESFTYNGIAHRNHNRLLGASRGVDGIKTGFTVASGFNLVASAERDGRRLVVAVFGGETSRSRDRRVADLMEQGFARLGEPQVARAETKAAAKSKKATPAATAPTAAEPPAPPRLEASDIAALTAEVADPSAAGDAAPAPAAPNGWSIQTGAYAKLDAAEKAATAAQRAVKGLAQGRPAVAKPEGGDKLFRARVVGLNEKQAKAACAEIKKKNKSCVALPPNPNVSLAHIGG